jgi:hypothetical protein
LPGKIFYAGFVGQADQGPLHFTHFFSSLFCNDKIFSFLIPAVIHYFFVTPSVAPEVLRLYTLQKIFTTFIRTAYFQPSAYYLEL